MQIRVRRHIAGKVVDRIVHEQEVAGVQRGVIGRLRIPSHLDRRIHRSAADGLECVIVGRGGMAVDAKLRESCTSARVQPQTKQNNKKKWRETQLW